MVQSLEERPFDQEMKQLLTKIANTIRHLSMDAIQKADSGHPGLPMGCAEIGAYLYGYALHYNPKNPQWMNRDRFILSAGHGSMLLYSCLHLSGYNLSLEEIKRFRQLHSKTPGHPESLDTEGVETTTGPLGQGLGNAVGMALGLKLLAEKFNSETFKIFDSKVFVLTGDGCMMEGVTSEVSSLAGHLGINNLIVIYDANKISLDGPLSESCSEDTKMRYLAYGWDVLEIDGHDLDAIHRAIQSVRVNQKKPVLIIARTTIGKGSPNRSGSSKAHGAPLGEEEVKLSKQALGLPLEDFFISPQVQSFFEKKMSQEAQRESQWKKIFQEWAQAHPDMHKEFERMTQTPDMEGIEEKLFSLVIKSPVAGRKASQETLSALADLLPQLYGGSADLSCSDLTLIKKFPVISPGMFLGRNIKYGVREFGMATIATGLSQTRMIIPFIGTFLTFSDYMRNAIRLAALMREKVIYQFTHDSIFLGEDGPTHQPIEHIATLRAIPHLQVIRPAGAHEVKMAWIAALRYAGPTALILSRQNIPEMTETHLPFDQGLGRGAYIVRKEKKKPSFTLFSTGSELSLALEVADALEKRDKHTRVISMPSWELFDKQSVEYRDSILGGDIGIRVSIEAASEMGWHKYIGWDGIAISMDGFGASAPASELAKEFGFTVDSILERIF